VLTASTFRQQWPAFSDIGVYTDAVYNFWQGIAAFRLNAERWGAMLDFGTSLFIAHHLVLAARDVTTANAGGIPGVVNGPQSSKTVESASVSYDTKAISLTDGGYWNLTTYGIQFLQISRMIGAGGIQL
jgi:hypothetical protein